MIIKLARDAATFGVMWGINWLMFASIRPYITIAAAVAFAVLVWCEIAQWRLEADLRENAKCGYVAGQPLIETRPWGEPRRVTYVGPDLGSRGWQIVRAEGSTYDWHVRTEDLSPVLFDIEKI